MRRYLAAATAAAVLLGSAVPAFADLVLPKLTLSSYTGLADVDDTYGVTGAVPFGIRAGFVVSKYFGMEGSYGKVFGDGERVPAREFPIDQWGLDFLLNLFPNSRVNPYLFAGWAQLNLDEPAGRTVRMNGGEFGAGFKLRLVQDPGARWDLRLDARNVITRNDPPLLESGTFTNHLFFTGGITMTLGNPDRDTDGDGVFDRFDRCPETILGAEVDPFGCVLDYDDDGVPDGIDRCAATPLGATVDEYGCPSDEDADGVMDGIDLCNDTIPGATVDEAGCALDTDGDGVFDGIDRCPGTPPRIMVDESGCPLKLAVSVVELEILTTGVLVLNDIEFESGTSVLGEGPHGRLDEVGNALTKWTDLVIEIGAHTDSAGDANENLKVSQARAQAVLEYLSARFPALEAARFTVVGYGASQPVSTNETAAGRSLNQRVEFKVLNPEVLERN